ncbi:hypothetical protein KP509_25G007100 [Ceratopteris richardii]|nr:hypothetical protein KP509_25G007100 [Ceratopteris richardii]
MLTTKVKSFLKKCSSCLWQKQCINSESLTQAVVIPVLSFLICCIPLLLNEAPAYANENFHEVVSVKFENSNMQVFSELSNSFFHEDTISPLSNPLFLLSDGMLACQEAYGLFPCSNSLPGNLFLILAYGFLLLTAAKLISKGSEQLLEVMNPGLIGGLLLPVLGALPDAALICTSGIGGTVEEAQQEVLVGIGVLAGSTTLILSGAWAGSLVAGRCDLSGPGNTAKDLTLTRGYDLFHTGITTDEQTRWGALIMIFSVAPYICAQLPLLDQHPEEGPESALAGCILALSGMVLYCSYQVASPWLQKKKIEEARLQLLRTSALQSISSFSSNLILSSSASPHEWSELPADRILREIFTYFDRNEDGKIQQDELRGLILGLNIDSGSFEDEEQVEKWLNEFDLNTDGMLSEAEFLVGIRNWANRVTKQRRAFKFQQIRDSIALNDPKFWGSKLEEAREALKLLELELEQDEEVSSSAEGENSYIDASKLYKESAIYLVLGALLAALFSDPLIDSIQGFSNASRIPPFFVAFVVVPFASNASELFSSIIFAMKKRKRNISLTYSQIYGSVTMNNTLCLGIFLAIVYARGLTWDFSSEVTVVLLNILSVGLIGVSRTTFPLWYAAPVISLYFISLGGVALLDNLLGWH